MRAKISGEPTRLKFQLARDSLRRKPRPLMNARGFFSHFRVAIERNHSARICSALLKEGRFPNRRGGSPPSPSLWRAVGNRCSSFLEARLDAGRGALTQTLAQIFHDLLDDGRARARKDEQVFRAFASSRKNNEIFRKEFWLMRDH